MIILDQSREYDTDFIDSIISNDDRTSTEQQILNAFNRHAYYLYTKVRDCVTSRKCKKLSVDIIRERLKETNHFTFTSTVLNLNIEQINYILFYVEKYLPAATR